MLQWVPAGRQTITLLGKAMPQAPVSVPLPPLVFAGIGTTYYVWAAREQAFSPGMSLYCAPFPNVRSDGSICFGAANQPPPVSCVTFPAAWQMFITSPFNGDLSDGKSQQYREDVRHQLCAVRRKQCYPASDLVPFKRLLDQCIVEDAVVHYLSGASGGNE